MSIIHEGELDKILTYMKRQEKPNYTQIQLLIAEVAASLEIAPVLVANAYRAVRHHMEAQFKLRSADDIVSQ